MRRALLALATVGLVFWAAPAFAQSSTSGDSSANAEGGSASSGGNRSSVSIHTEGGASVGVAQGSVSDGSRAGSTAGDGDQQGAATSGDSGSGQVTGVTPAAAPNATEDGVVSQIDLPVLDLGESQTAAESRPDFLTWAIAGLIVVGLVVLYRRLPRSTHAS